MENSNTFQTKKITAVEAKNEAQKLAFAPIAFQAVMVLRKTGILQLISESLGKGLTIEEIAEKTNVSKYGVRVLVESALVSNVVEKEGENYKLSKIGYFVIHDDLTSANFDFTQDVCYEGMFHLDKAIEEGKPSGLKVFGDWPTLYEGLATIEEPFRTSWFTFDHYYSDKSFPAALKIVFDKPVKKLLDIGGNTGKWATQCVNHNPDVEVTIFDLPGQINTAKGILSKIENSDRIKYNPGDLLKEDTVIPAGFDIYWMSQFLDCFSEEEVISILSRIKNSMDENSRIYIMETFWDNQMFEGAAYSLVQTSLYFTCIANGNSKMYGKPEFEKLILESGLKIEHAHEDVGIGHTILVCKK